MANENELTLQENAQPVAQEMQERPTVAAAVDIYENHDEYLIYADVPGVAEDGVDINLDRGELTIYGRRTTAKEAAANDQQSEPLAREYQAWDFRRVFRLPETIDVDGVHAKLSQGVLELHLPKSPEVKPRRIQVTAG